MHLVFSPRPFCNEQGGTEPPGMCVCEQDSARLMFMVVRSSFGSEWSMPRLHSLINRMTFSRAVRLQGIRLLVEARGEAPCGVLLKPESTPPLFSSFWLHGVY